MNAPLVALDAVLVCLVPLAWMLFVWARRVERRRDERDQRDQFEAEPPTPPLPRSGVVTADRLVAPASVDHWPGVVGPGFAADWESPTTAPAAAATLASAFPDSELIAPSSSADGSQGYMRSVDIDVDLNPADHTALAAGITQDLARSGHVVAASGASEVLLSRGREVVRVTVSPMNGRLGVLASEAGGGGVLCSVLRSLARLGYSVHQTLDAEILLGRPAGDLARVHVTLNRAATESAPAFTEGAVG